MLRKIFYNLFGIILLCSYYSYAEKNSTLAFPTIKKCFCKSNEVLSQSEGCIEKNQLYVQIWNASRSDVDVKDITNLPFVIEDLVCPDNYVLETVHGWAFIYEDGKLMQFNENNTDHYCIENIINNSGDLFQISKICVMKHFVHLCCEVDEYMDSSDRCTSIPNSSVKTVATDWFSKLLYMTSNVYCKDNEKTHKTFPLDLSLSDLKGYLADYDEMTRGKFCLGMYGDENELYPGITFCTSSEMNVTDLQIPKVQYCCLENEAFDIENFECLPHEEIFNFPLNIKWPSNGIMREPPTIIMNCSYFSILTLENDTMHHLHPNGSLYTESGDIIQHDDYCLGVIVNDKTVHHSGLICHTNEEEDHCRWRWDIYRICLGISSFFLVLTLVVYMGIADLRKRISGVCLISELTALLVSQITLIVIQMKQSDFSDSECLAAGVIEIIFVLASFFWLNIMCYDVWSTFRVFRPFSEKVLNLKLFLKYSLYAWGIPFMVGLLALTLELVDVPELKPDFTPKTGCFFSQKDTALHWFYLYGIILLLLLINLAFFVHLAFTLVRNQMEKRKHLKTKEGNQADKPCVDIENIKLHGKLFVIMGVPWVIEAFTSLASPESDCYIWFLDLFNLLRGFFIFIIFVCKKSTKDKLMAEWFPSYKGDEERTSSSRKISTSTLSLSNWLPSIQGRKISKVSLTSGGNVNLEAFNERPENVIEEERTEKF